MSEVKLYNEHPVLSMPLRFRVHVAGMCMVSGGLALWLPEVLYLAITFVALVCAAVVGLYAINRDSDHTALLSANPRLESRLHWLATAGALTSGTWRWMTHDYMARDGLFLFLIAVALLRVSLGESRSTKRRFDSTLGPTD